MHLLGGSKGIVVSKKVPVFPENPWCNSRPLMEWIRTIDRLFRRQSLSSVLTGIFDSGTGYSSISACVRNPLQARFDAKVSAVLSLFRTQYSRLWSTMQMLMSVCFQRGWSLFCISAVQHHCQQRLLTSITQPLYLINSQHILFQLS